MGDQQLEDLRPLLFAPRGSQQGGEGACVLLPAPEALSSQRQLCRSVQSCVGPAGRGHLRADASGAGSAPRCPRVRGRGVGWGGLGLGGIYDADFASSQGSSSTKPQVRGAPHPRNPTLLSSLCSLGAEAARDGLGLGPKAETKPHGADTEAGGQPPSLHGRLGLPEVTAGDSSHTGRTELTGVHSPRKWGSKRQAATVQGPRDPLEQPHGLAWTAGQRWLGRSLSSVTKG